MLSLSKHELYYQAPFDRLRVMTSATTVKVPNNFSLYQTQLIRTSKPEKVKCPGMDDKGFRIPVSVL
jgi:hypothetical protein